METYKPTYIDKISFTVNVYIVYNILKAYICASYYTKHRTSLPCVCVYACTLWSSSQWWFFLMIHNDGNLIVTFLSRLSLLIDFVATVAKPLLMIDNKENAF